MAAKTILTKIKSGGFKTHDLNVYNKATLIKKIQIYIQDIQIMKTIHIQTNGTKWNPEINTHN